MTVAVGIGSVAALEVVRDPVIVAVEIERIRETVFVGIDRAVALVSIEDPVVVIIKVGIVGDSVTVFIGDDAPGVVCGSFCKVA